MRLYKISIKPCASYTSPLQSDTFFGAFCWSYRYLYGEEHLTDFLNKNLDEGPQIVFSNAYPQGYLPLPMGIRDEERGQRIVEKSKAKATYQQNKIYKKCALIERAGFQKIQKGDRNGYSRFLAKDQNCQESVIHNAVNRSSGTVEKSENGGNLFSRDEYFVREGALFDVYILSLLDPMLIEKVLVMMFELGIGGAKSAGKGYFRLISIDEEAELSAVENPNAYIALSNFIPAAADPTDGSYKTLVKFGKTDREYSAGEYPFKKPLLYIQAGAVFRTAQVQEYYGRFIKNVSLIPGVVVNACTIAVPVRI